MVEARFEGGKFTCGTCGTDLMFTELPSRVRNISIEHVDIQGPCGHDNQINNFRE